jgi:hypothetical protein
MQDPQFPHGCNFFLLDKINKVNEITQSSPLITWLTTASTAQCSM